MAWVSPRTWVTNEVVTAAQLNQDIRDNFGCFAAMIAYTDGALLSGWTDYSATAGGRYIVATPTSGSTGGTVGAAMTNLENKTHTHTGPSHTHTGPSHTHTGPSHDHPVFSATNAAYNMDMWGSSTRGVVTSAGGTGATGAEGTGATGAEGTGATGAYSTGDFAPFIQLLAMKKDA